MATKLGKTAKLAIFLSFNLLFLTNAFARIDGVEYAELSIGGQAIEFPIGNDERKADIYYLKKALNGDNEAREIFLGGGDERLFFVGDDTPRWLKITKTSEELL